MERVCVVAARIWKKIISSVIYINRILNFADESN